jgi:hypothetical protein
MNPDICVNRHKGNRESEAANASLRDAKTLLRIRVEVYLTSRAPWGPTSDDIEQSLGLSHQPVSPRLVELKARGIVVPGERRMTRSGRYARALVHAEWAND